MEVRFVADRIAIKPPKNDAMSVELFTGSYSIPGLAMAYLWQAQSANFEVVIRPISPEHAGAIVHGKVTERIELEGEIPE